MGDQFFASGRQLDVICLGRLGVDLYAQQIGAPLEDVGSFAKYLGGSSANIAFGTARLGLKSAMLTRVGDDHMGRFLTRALEREGCDTRGIAVDRERLTAMVLLGIKDRETFPLVFYRENCADMALSEADIDEAFIASAKALLITGTHFSTEGVFQASSQALDYAEKHGVKRVLDIDYRPVLWGLTGKADGETRFIASAEVSAHVQRILPRFDLVVGTEEEFQIAGGSEDLLSALRRVREVTAATLVVKLGAQGCTVIHGAIPARLEDGEIHRGIRVEVLNVLGAGDAFMSGFLRGWLTGGDDAQCCRLANACGGLVVSRHACAPAMPTLAELDYLFASPVPITRPDLDATLNRLHRVGTLQRDWRQLFIFAFDHRYQAGGGGPAGGRRSGADSSAQGVVRSGHRAGRGGFDPAGRGGGCRAAGRRAFRPGCAECRHRPRLVGGAAGGIAEFAAAGLRAWSLGGQQSAELAERADRQVPGAIPPRRRTPAAPGAGGPAQGPVPGGPGQRPCAAAGSHPAEAACLPATGRALPGHQATVQPGHLPGSGGRSRPSRRRSGSNSMT
ncbi:5-dehydro-2-deoxygluconokinase [Pseudomonas psychrotolerans]|nr:5-dehydro-2-deoxygluconokinase [Pseudomonas psychrotolerans]